MAFRTPCLDCGKPILSDALYCRKCARKNKHIVARIDCRRRLASRGEETDVWKYKTYLNQSESKITPKLSVMPERIAAHPA